MSVIAPSCSGGGEDESPPAPTAAARACDPVVVDALDPRSTQHLLPGAPTPTYAVDPPTSGPHLSSDVASGAQSEPLEPPAQVTVLEVGRVLVQYRPSLPEKDRALLLTLVADEVVLAPNPALPETVIATAWRHRLACRSVDLTALQAFISERKGKGPG